MTSGLTGIFRFLCSLSVRRQTDRGREIDSADCDNEILSNFLWADLKSKKGTIFWTVSTVDPALKLKWLFSVKKNIRNGAVTRLVKLLAFLRKHPYLRRWFLFNQLRILLLFSAKVSKLLKKLDPVAKRSLFRIVRLTTQAVRIPAIRIYYSVCTNAPSSVSDPDPFFGYG